MSEPDGTAAPSDQDDGTTLTDEEIETRDLGTGVGGAALSARDDTGDTGDDTGDTTDTADTGDDSGDVSDTGDDAGEGDDGGAA
jgi:hypothetical protein